MAIAQGSEMTVTVCPREQPQRIMLVTFRHVLGQPKDQATPVFPGETYGGLTLRSPEDVQSTPGSVLEMSDMCIALHHECWGYNTLRQHTT